MQLWVEIVARELAMLATLLALGIGPASFLGKRFEAAARLAIAPAFGLCLSTCVFTTLIWFTAARHTYWLIPLMAVVSVTVALWRRRAFAGVGPSCDGRPVSRWLRPSDALALAAVCVIVAGPLSYTLHERHTVGPMGFRIEDAAGYTEMADGAVRQSIREAGLPAAKHANASQRAWTEFALGVQNIDAAPLSANLNELLGLGATETQSLFMIVFLVVDALGAFAAVRYFAPKPSWAAPLAGVLFAGPLFLQLLADGSQAATCGIALMLPIATVGAETLRERRFANLVLLALLAAGLMALYPLYVPGVAVAAGLVLLVSAIVSRLRGRLSRQALLAGAWRVGVVLMLTIAFNVVSFTRNLSFWHEATVISMANKPRYELPISVLPGWLLQTRQFFFLTDLAHASAHEVLIGVILPAIFIVVILVGMWRRRLTLILIPVILVFAALAEYTSVSKGCSYCVDRNLLPVAPLSVALLAMGVAALATAQRRWMRWAGVLVAVAAVVAAADQTRTERLLFAADSYFLDGGNRALLADLPPHPGPVDLEGYGQDPDGRAVVELALVYTLAAERNNGEVSIPNEYADYGAFEALAPEDPVDSDLTPSYRYVLTRFGGVQTDRRVIARAGPLALEERFASLDVTVDSGVATSLVRLDKRGYAPVVGPLHMLVLGGGSKPPWVLLRFQTLAQARVVPQSGVRSHAGSHTLIVCVRATGTAPLRRASLTLEGGLFPGNVPAEQFAEPEPPQGIWLVSMRAATDCSLTDPDQARH